MRLVVAAAVLVAAMAAVTLALARTPAQQALIDSTVRFLQESQGADGGFAPPGGEPTQGTSAWVALALAGAGINPQDQARCGASAYDFLVAHFQAGLEEEIAWPRIATTSFERELLVVDAAGADPHHFAGYDLVRSIVERQGEDGSFPYVAGGRGEANATIFAILALSPVHEPGLPERIDRAAEWLVAQQNDDGGWYFSGRGAESETDMTGAAIEALAAAGPPAGEPAPAAYEEAIEGGLDYLRRAQLPDGGFPAMPAREGEANVASTAWAVQGIWASGGNPEAWTTGPEAREPLGYMESMQQPDGHIRWRASSDLNGIWMTAYVTPAFAGQALPIPAAARFDPRASHGEAADCLDAGEGGESPQRGAGVLTGGGGHGAPAFSRPKAQSKGRTPGGARVVRNDGVRARDHSATRRGTNERQPTGSQAGEAKDRREAARAGRAVQREADEVGEAATRTASANARADGASSGAAGGAQPLTATEGAAAGRGTGASKPPIPPGPPAPSATAGKEVSGTLIGAAATRHDGALAFGAPGLRSAGAGSGNEDRLALVIVVAALVVALIGAGWERRRGEAAA